MANKKSNQKSFKDLVNIKKKINIMDENNEVLFYLEELNGNQFDEFLKITKFEPNNQDKDISVLGDEYIIWLLRNMVKGDIDITSATDNEIVETVANLGMSIKNEIESALDILVVQNIHVQIEKIKNLQQSLINIE